MTTVNITRSKLAGLIFSRVIAVSVTSILAGPERRRNRTFATGGTFVAIDGAAVGIAFVTGRSGGLNMLRNILAATVFAAVHAVILAAVLVAVFVAVLANTNPARAAEGPWCALLNFGADISEDCQYRSLEECLPAVTSGFRGFCNPNPRWQGATDEPRLHRKRAVRHQ